MNREGSSTQIQYAKTILAEKISRFDETMAEIEQWLVKNDVPHRATRVLLRDRNRRYYIRLNIGPTGAEMYASVALYFWKFVAEKIPLQQEFLEQLESTNFEPYSTLKKVSRSWIIVIDPDQSFLSSKFPTFDEWCVFHEGDKLTDVGHAHTQVDQKEPVSFAQSNASLGYAQSVVP